MSGEVGRLTNSGGNNHQQNPSDKKKKKKEKKENEKTSEEARDLFVPKEKVDPQSYSRDPKLKKLLLKHANKPKAANPENK